MCFSSSESDDEYSDDDDISWKVRRSAAKCLEAIVSTRHDLLQDFYKTLSPALISRFKEREENVKADIFCAYISLLKQTLPTQSWVHASDEESKEDIPLTMLQNQVSDATVNQGSDGMATYLIFLVEQPFRH